MNQHYNVQYINNRMSESVPLGIHNYNMQCQHQFTAELESRNRGFLIKNKILPANRRVWPDSTWPAPVLWPGYFWLLGSGTTRRDSVCMLGSTGFLVRVTLSWLGVLKSGKYDNEKTKKIFRQTYL